MENLPTVKSDAAIMPYDDLYLNENRFEMIQRAAKLFASSDMVPKQFQNKVGNCVIALEMAHRLNALPLEIMQNMYVVHGTPSFAGKFVHALFNRSNEWDRLTLEYEYQGGEVVSCTASSTYKPTGKKQSFTLTWDMVKKEGWDKPKGSMASKWVTMRQLMFSYRTAAMFVKIFAPELMMGMPTTDEIIDAGEAIIVDDATAMRDSNPDFLQQEETPGAKQAEEELNALSEKPLEDQAPLDGNWWEVPEHWKFRKGIDFLWAVMAGFNMPYPEKDLRIVIDGKDYLLDSKMAESYSVFIEKNPDAVGCLNGAADEYYLAVRKKFVFSMKMAPELWEALENENSLDHASFTK